MPTQYPSVEELKIQAKQLRNVLRAICDAQVGHGHSLEILSRVYGLKDWNTLVALASRGVPKPDSVAEAPKLPPSSSGTLIGTLSLFEPESPVRIAFEEEWVDGWEEHGPTSHGYAVTSSTEFDVYDTCGLSKNLRNEKGPTLLVSHTASRSSENLDQPAFWEPSEGDLP